MACIKGVVMNVGKNEEGYSYDFYSAQIGYTIETSLGDKDILENSVNLYYNDK
jgi:hypothetical protein